MSANIDKTAEDVAAKLAGMKECPCCHGEGMLYPDWDWNRDPDDQDIAELNARGEECWMCKGRRWVFPRKRQRFGEYSITVKE